MAAFWAGKIPKKSPTEIETNNPRKTDHDVTDAGRGVADLISMAIEKPINIPMMPPVPVKNMASIKNCLSMLLKPW